MAALALRNNLNAVRAFAGPCSRLAINNHNYKSTKHKVMNLKESINHNKNCWQKELQSIDQEINKLIGKKEALEGVIECIDIIESEQENNTELVMQKVYIAGKVTGEDIAACAQKFKNASNLVKYVGYQPVNPLEVVGTYDITWEKAMRKCVAALTTCDAVLLLPCYADSKGAKIENNICLAIGIPVAESIEELKNHLK